MSQNSALKPLVPVASASLIAALVLTGCSAQVSAEPSPRPSATTVELTAEAKAACEEIFAREVPDANRHIVTVFDGSASNARVTLDPALASALQAASAEDGAFTLIAVEGADTAPRIVAKSVALSTEGPRDRPSVGKIAEVIPACVEQVLMPRAEPTTPGTDLHRAIALASEMLRGASELWVQSDFVSTAGSFRLDEAILTLDPQAAADQISQHAPVDLRGSAVRITGIGNTAQAIRTADREWLRDLARGMCATWNGSLCDEITTDPVEPTPRDGTLPEDPLPSFPAPTEMTVAGACHFDVPAHLTFEADSADLRGDAAAVLDPPLQMALRDPGTTLEVIGHTASLPGLGGPSVDALSQDRADAVAGFFMASGIDTSRVRAVGVGDTQPLAEDLDPVTGQQVPALAAAERRVEILVHHTSCAT